MNKYANIFFRNALRNVRNKFNALAIQIARTHSQGQIFIGSRVAIPVKHGLKIGKKARLGDDVKILIEKCSKVIEYPKVYIGDNVKIGDRVVLSVYEGEEISIGDNASLQSGCIIIGDVTIGKGSLLSSNIFISSRNHTFDKSPHMSIREQDIVFGQKKNEFVIIGDDCWLGWGVVVGQGLEIGNGSIVGSNSVVRENIPPNQVWGGVPARFIKNRFDA